MRPPAQRSAPLYNGDAADAEIGSQFTAGQWPVAVYGLGKMGLPAAAVFADVTGAVIGVDIDESVVDRVNRGESPVRGEPGLDALVDELVEAGALVGTTDATDAAARATVHVILVPTTLAGRRPDLSNLRAAARSVGGGIAPGDIVFVESTVPPHTCRSVVRPTIADEADLSPDQFGVAFCPERTASGRALEDIRGAYPRVVGGVDEESTRIAELLYAELTANEVIPVADAATAECIKLFEGVYRDVNIALANELATFAEDLDVDVRAAIRAANTQPYCDLHSPGPGVGGHCIPYYPWFLMQGRCESARLLRTARLVNERMPAFTAERGLALLAARDRQPSESTALLLGVAYRPDVAEARMSPAVDIAAELSTNGVSVSAVDPVLDDFPPIEATVVELAAVGELDPDLIALVTPHAAFEGLDWSAFDDPVILDCHDALDETAVPHAVHTLGGG